MQNQLYPSESIENSLESYLPKIGVKSQVIYVIILIFILSSFAALPFILVDISVQAPGVIRTEAEKTEIRSLISGRIKSVEVSENQNIIKGQTIYQIESTEIDNKIRLNNIDKNENNEKTKDIKTLLTIEKNNLFSVFQIRTSLYSQALKLFRSQIQENRLTRQKILDELKSDEKLFDQKVISKREINAKYYELNKLDSEYQTLFEIQKNKWESELHDYEHNSEQTHFENQQLIQNKEFFTIYAPLSGNIQQLISKYTGSYVQNGELLGIISPDSSLLVECYLPPQDIGLIKNRMLVRFQIEAFNYNQWGLVNGEILEISKDFVLINEQPVFKVKCKLNTQEVSLPTGYTAKLKKGMTLRARFIVAERSLFQLLYDKVDDWVNPTL